MEAWNFVSQAPLICNFGQQIMDIETLLVFEMLKMIELKLLTKTGRPEQAIILLSNRVCSRSLIEDEEFRQLFPFSSKQLSTLEFDSDVFISRAWCLYKLIKYKFKLTELKQEHYRFKMVNMLS